MTTANIKKTLKQNPTAFASFSEARAFYQRKEWTWDLNPRLGLVNVCTDPTDPNNHTYAVNSDCCGCPARVKCAHRHAVEQMGGAVAVRALIVAGVLPRIQKGR